MPALKIFVEHNLSVAEASERIRNLLSDLKVRFGDKVKNLQESWTENRAEFRFEAMGFQVAGVLSIHTSHAELTGKIPVAALPFKKRIESVIRERMTVLLS